jgi:uncharacterized protein (TIGR02246 family)
MSKPLRLLAVLVLMTSLLATCVLAAPNDAEDVRNVVARFATAWNHHDMDAFGKLFATNADFVTVIGFQMKGRESIQLRHAWMHGAVPENTFPDGNPAHYGMFKHSTMRFIRIDVRFLRKDVAIAHVSWELLGDARTPKPRRGVLLFVLTRQNGGWLIAAAQNTEINRTVK